jgi:predicted metal-dependent hydrolase
MARTHPHAEASYKIIAFEDGSFGVEVSIPDSHPTIVTTFASEQDAEAWIAGHRRRVRSQAESGYWLRAQRGRSTRSS